MATVAVLTAVVKANTKRFNKGLKRAQKRYRSFIRTIKSGRRIILFGTAAFVAMGVAIAATINKFRKIIDTQAKFAARIGVSTEALVGLQRAAELSGVSIQQLDLGLQRMARRIGEASQGTGEAVKALKELGLDAKKLNKISPDKQFLKIADAMKKFKVTGDKLRLTMKLFDSDAVGLVNILKLGGDAIQKIMKDTVKFGFVLNKSGVRQVEDMNDSLSNMFRAFGAVGLQITNVFAPIIKSVADDIFNFMTKSLDLRAVIKNLFETAIIFIGKMRDSLAGLTTVFQGFAIVGLATLKALGAGILFSSSASNLFFKIWSFGFISFDKTISEMSSQLKTVDNALTDTITSGIENMRDFRQGLNEDASTRFLDNLNKKADALRKKLDRESGKKGAGISAQNNINDIQRRQRAATVESQKAAAGQQSITSQDQNFLFNSSFDRVDSSLKAIRDMLKTSNTIVKEEKNNKNAALTFSKDGR